MVSTVDPLTAVLTRDWAAVGGWSLFISLCLLIVIGAFREWWVPGSRYKRTEALLEKSVDTTQIQARQADKLGIVGEVVSNLLSEATPHKGQLGAKPGDSE